MSDHTVEHPIRAVIFDLGGVVFPSPFEAFDVYDGRAGLDVGTTRAIVRVSSETGAWAALERGELTMAQFCAALDAEAAALGHTISTAAVMATIGEMSGARPEMVTAIRRLRDQGIHVGALRTTGPTIAAIKAAETTSPNALARSVRSPIWRRCSTPSWSRRASACASPIRASTRSSASGSAWNLVSVHSSMTSASTSNPPASWACARSRWSKRPPRCTSSRPWSASTSVPHAANV